MPSFKIISDSSCDLPGDLIKANDISVVPYYVTLDQINYLKENVDISLETFYREIISKKIYPKTSLPPISDYIDFFRPFLEEGMDILCICLTSKFSGSYQSANIAKNTLQEEFPDRRMEIVDSMQVTITQGMLVLEGAKLRDRGFSLEETAAALNKLKTKGRIVFTVDSLDYLQKGGRIGMVTAFAGSLLNIKPIILMKNGELVPHARVRGRKKAIQEVLDIVNKELGNAKAGYHFGVLYCDNYEEVCELREMLTTVCGVTTENPPYRVGVTIGTHIGPTAIGVGYMPAAESL